MGGILGMGFCFVGFGKFWKGLKWIGEKVIRKKFEEFFWFLEIFNF
jgi:hypothetical protein